MNNYNLPKILLKVKSTELTRLEQNYLIKLSFSIALSFLKAKYNKSIKSIEKSFHSLDDLAMDSIVPLFVKNSEGEIGIVKSMEKWNDTIDSESSANYFLSRIIWSAC